MAKSVASGFTISGLLDRNASTRSDYPVERIPVGEIADHPANAAYSMDDAGIAQLARSIKEEGLTDLPLVRKLDDGGWQMVSGHRRKRAAELAADSGNFLATIQIGVTLAGFLTSATAAQSLAGPLAGWFVGLVPALEPHIAIIQNVSVVVVTILMSYFSLVFGELVPKLSLIHI